MTREQLLNYIPPCGLVCYTCPGFVDGAIREHSMALLKLQEGYREFLDKRLPDEYRNLLEKYDTYIETLHKNASPHCPGCRKIDGKGPGCIKDCFIPECVKKHSVDFCGECHEFPCKRVEKSKLYGKEAKQGFLDGGEYIKQVGAESFFEYKKGVSHCINYKSD